MEKIVFVFILVLCYVNSAVVQERILNGITAAENQFPYAVSLQYSSQISPQYLAHKCSGALISFQHVLTTASCTSAVVNGMAHPIPPAELKVYAGNNLLTAENTSDRLMTVSGITIHPNYTHYPTYSHDIAIIILSSAYNASVVGVLPISANDAIPASNTVCQFVGWGATNTTYHASNNLRYASKYIYDQTQCGNVYANASTIYSVLPTMLCAASANGLTAACDGDYGGPLVCNGELTGLLILTNNCVASSQPELYTRVSHYEAWIKSVVAGAAEAEVEVASSATTLTTKTTILTTFVIVYMKIFR